MKPGAIATGARAAPERQAGLQAVALAVVCLLPAVAGLIWRPPMPLDELRYLAVGWEMWRDGHWLVPHINGATYAHKPPVLFWLMHAGWSVFGVNQWSPRLIGALGGLAAVLMTQRLARALWPADAGSAELAPWILGGGILWLVCSQMVMFDVLMSIWSVVGMWAVWHAANHQRLSGWWWIGVAIGGGVLTKGPVVLLQVLLPALLAPLWQTELRRNAGRWYLRVFGALLLGAPLALMWAIPAAISGGPEYASAIFWHQTADRMENSFAHARPWWFYLAALPVLFLPWTVMPRLWRGWTMVPRDSALRFLLTWVAAVFVAISLVSAKQPHYVVPLMPAIALIVAHALSTRAATGGTADRTAALTVMGLLCVGGAGYLLWSARRWGSHWQDSGMGWLLPVPLVMAWMARATTLSATVRRTALGMAVFVASGIAGFTHNPAFRGLDLRLPAQAISQLQQQGALVAVLDHYQGQFTFLGQLERPLVRVKPEDFAAWAGSHPGAYVLAFKRPALPGEVGGLIAEFPYRTGSLRIWRLGAADAARAQG